LSFGPYPSVTLAQARGMRDAARALLANDEDPGAVKQEQKQQKLAASEHSFAHMAEAYMAKVNKEGRATATQKKTTWFLGMAIADFGKKPIADITAPMVLACLRKVEAKGNYETARRLRAKIGAVFRYAVANGVADTDPTFALIRPTVTSRAAIIEPARIGELLRAIDGYTGQTTTRIALQLQAILVQRPGELRHAKWAQFDLDAGIWEIPAAIMKMRRPHRVPLPAQSIDLILNLRKLTGNGYFLFPSIRSVFRPISENTLNAALRRMGYSGDEMTAHGFRASFSTLANESRMWHPDAIERALAHVETNQVRRAYDRGQHWDERVRLADWWAGYLETLKAG